MRYVNDESSTDYTEPLKEHAMMDLTDLGLGEGRVYRPGELVDPGRYRRLDHPASVVIEGHPDYLPPSFDGTVALYTRIEIAADLLETRAVAN